MYQAFLTNCVVINILHTPKNIWCHLHANRSRIFAYFHEYLFIVTFLLHFMYSGRKHRFFLF